VVEPVVMALLGYEDKPFVEFLKSQKLTDTVRHYVQHAIAMVTDDASTTEVVTDSSLAVRLLVCLILWLNATIHMLSL